MYLYRRGFCVRQLRRRHGPVRAQRHRIRIASVRAARVDHVRPLAQKLAVARANRPHRSLHRPAAGVHRMPPQHVVEHQPRNAVRGFTRRVHRAPARRRHDGGVSNDGALPRAGLDDRPRQTQPVELRHGPERNPVAAGFWPGKGGAIEERHLVAARRQVPARGRSRGTGAHNCNSRHRGYATRSCGYLFGHVKEKRSQTTPLRQKRRQIPTFPRMRFCATGTMP